MNAALNAAAKKSHCALPRRRLCWHAGQDHRKASDSILNWLAGWPELACNQWRLRSFWASATGNIRSHGLNAIPRLIVHQTAAEFKHSQAAASREPVTTVGSRACCLCQLGLCAQMVTMYSQGQRSVKAIVLLPCLCQTCLCHFVCT